MEPPAARRVLSASSTWIYKHFFPWLGVIFFTAITILAWRMSPKKDQNVALFRIAGPAIGVPSVAAAFWYGRRLKHVEMDEKSWYVSSGRRQISFPFSAIETCEVKWQGRDRQGSPFVTINLRQPSALGREIVFLAAQPWNYEHSIVAELRERRDRATGAVPD